MNAEDDLDLGSYLEILRRRWLIIVIAVVAALGAAALLCYRTEVRYRAEARVLVRTTAAQDRLDPSSGAATNAVRRLQNEVEFATSNEVEEAATAAYGRPFTVTVRPDSASDTLTIAAEAATAAEAAKRANTYAETLVAQRTASTADELLGAMTTLNRRIGEIGNERDELLAQIDRGADKRRFTGQLDALDAEETSLRANLREIQIAGDLAAAGSQRITKAAEAPSRPFEPAWARNLVLAGAVGLLFGIGGAFLRETLDGTIRTKAQLDAASTLPTLGTLPSPNARTAKGRRALVTSRSGPFAEALRSLRSSVLFAKSDEPDLVSFVLTSANPAEGKSTTVVNLASALARAGQHVVVVDADLRRPLIGPTCGIDDTRPGLTDVLRPALSHLLATGAHIPVYPEQITGEALFDVLPAGKPIDDPAEILGAADFAQTITDLRAKYDVVLIDTAPVLPVSDALSVAAGADATILVARADSTTADQIGAALELLQRADANLIGTILTNVDRRATYGGYGYDSNRRS